jgi:hypothetical protein
MLKLKCFLAIIVSFFALGAARAQTATDPAAAQVQPQPLPTTAATAPAAAPATPPGAWKVAGIDVSGMADGYFSLGFNHPADNESLLRNFDDKANEVELNMAKVTMDLAPKPTEPIGVHLDVGFGRAFDIMSATEKDASFMRFFEQGYVYVKPASWKGIEVDLGKFVTSAGAEVIETSSNFNYSRSLLFSWAIPYDHFGMRVSAPIGKQFTAGVQLVSGWNNIVTDATYKTVGLTGAWTRSKFSWTNTWYGGPDENKADRGYRNLYDTVLTVAPNAKTSLYLNFDYVHDKPNIGPAYQVAGIAGAAKFQATKKFYVSPRMEYFDDANGGSTGTAQQVKEVTLTGNYAFEARLSGIAEYRRDWSDVPFFNRGNQPGSSKSQPTMLIGLVVQFKPKQ